MKKLIVLLICVMTFAVFPLHNDLRDLNKQLNEGSRSLRQVQSFTNENSNLDTLIVDLLDRINADSIRQTMQWLEDFGTRFMLAPNRKEIAKGIRDRFIALGINNCVIDSFQTHSVYTFSDPDIDTVTWQYNVVATIPGKYNPGKVFMTSGHYDSFTSDDPMTLAPGADDDASGVAAAIEIARIINDAGFEPNSTIKLAAFAAEEFMTYSTESGASYYANNAVNYNENIVFYITNDMIAFSDTSSGWKFRLLNHDSVAWVTKLGIYTSTKYSSLTAINTEQGNEYGADDLPFHLAGIPAVFLMENDFSPYYHSNNDLVEHCNLDYCAEVTKVSAAMLIYASETPEPVSDYFIVNPGDGSTLIPCWKANTEPDLEGYHIYVGEEAGIYNITYTTTDTSFIISSLNTDVKYFIGVTAFNNDGNESLVYEKSDAPALVTMDKGILIVCDSEGGIYNPTTEEIMHFYDSLCIHFEHQQINVFGMEYLSLGTIGEYSSILWHIDNYQVQSHALSTSTDALRNFLNLGGHAFLSVYKPGKVIESIKNYPASYTNGSFMKDYAHVASSENEDNRWFAGANPIGEEYNPVFIDSLKIPGANHCIPYVEVMTPTPEGEIIYLYDTNYDTSSIQGSYYGKIVGIENKNLQKNLVITSFPLFYLNYDQARMLVYKVMHDKFGETYFNFDDHHINSAMISIFPNPAKNKLFIEYHLPEMKIGRIEIYSIEGQIIETLSVSQLAGDDQKITIDISELKKGIYILQITTADYLFEDKIFKY